MTPDYPHILLIMTDQQRVDTLGFRGETPCRTPHIDRLAAEGISYDRAVCASPLCTPSRAALFTGKYPHQVDMLGNADTLQEPPVLTEALKSCGYHTAYAGKWHLEPQGQPKAFRGREKALGLDAVHGGEMARKGERVIDRWFDEADGQGSFAYSEWCEAQGLPDGWPVSDPEVRTTRTPSMTIPKPKRQMLQPDQTYDAWVTDIALRQLAERPSDKPFFQVVSYFGPHPPFLIPEPFYSLYKAEGIARPPNFGSQSGKPRANTTSFYHQLFKDHGESWEDWQAAVAVYWGYCTMMDRLVGKMLAAYEARGLLDDTLVIFLSDHGEMLGSHGLWHKMMPYEEGLRVPLILRWPGKIGPGLRSQAVVSLIDVVPTVLTAVGAAVPASMQGRELTPSFKTGEEFQQDAYRFAEHRPLGAWHQVVDWRLVVDSRFKYVWNRADLDELYDLATDPFELENRINDPTLETELQRLRSRLFAWMEETADPLTAGFAAESSGF